MIPIIATTRTRSFPPAIIKILRQVRRSTTTALPRWSTTRSCNNTSSNSASTTTLVVGLFFCSSFIGVSSLSFSTSSSSSSSFFTSSFRSRLLSSSTKKPSPLYSLATIFEILTVTNTSNCSNEESFEKLDTTMAIATATATPTATANVTVQPFDDSVLSYDHYNGVTIHLDKYHTHHRHNNSSSSSNNEVLLETEVAVKTFARKLEDSLRSWKLEGKKGIWVHALAENSMFIDVCIQNGFQFHKIVPKISTMVGTHNHASSNNLLVLSQWLPDSRNKLPLGPTHQIGVGCVVFNPQDPSQMLVVKEKSGPAASYDLWKMPTGLVDPNEYVQDGARRELHEETSLNATLQGILSIRQAHRGGGATSDMFFVCSMELDKIENNNSNNESTQQRKEIQQWKACEEEIADIQWMSVEDYCNQTRWSNSPLYEELNDLIQNESKNKQRQKNDACDDNNTIDTDSDNISTNVRVSSIIEHRQLELGFGRTNGKTEALFIPKATVFKWSKL